MGKKPSLVSNKLQPDKQSFLDTIIILCRIDNSSFDSEDLTEKKAISCLYRFFKDKRVLPRKEENKNNTNEGRLCVDYDTIYKIQTRTFSGAIISYWLGPIDLNGHCFQPQKAIIRHTTNGYRITDQNFVLTNFAIDSTVRSNIYGYDYDCGGKGVLRNFKIALK